MGLATPEFIVNDLPHSYALNVLNAFVSCHLEYCSSVWTGISRVTLEPLLKIQRWAMGFVFKERIGKNNQVLFNTEGVLPLKQRWEYVIYGWIFKCYRNPGIKGFTQILSFQETTELVRRPLIID